MFGNFFFFKILRKRKRLYGPVFQQAIAIILKRFYCIQTQIVFIAERIDVWIITSTVMNIVIWKTELKYEKYEGKITRITSCLLSAEKQGV